MTPTQVSAFYRLNTKGEIWSSYSDTRRPHTNTLQGMARRGWVELVERYGEEHWYYIYKLTPAGREAFKQAVSK